MRLLVSVLCLALFAHHTVAQESTDPTVEVFRRNLADKSVDREKLRQEILAFVRSHAGSSAAVQASEVLTKLPSPLDKLDAKSIPELDQFTWQPKELVSVIGEHRGRHGHQVTCVGWTRDGKKVISGGIQSYLRCFDSATMRPLWKVGTGHYTTCLALSSDSKTLAAGTATGHLHVFDITGEKPVQTGQFQIGTSHVYSVDISANGKLLAAGVYDGLIHTFDLDGSKPKERTQLSGHKTGVRAVRFMPNSTTLAGAAADGTIRFWAFKGDQVEEGANVEAHKGAISCIRFNAHGTPGTTMVAGTDDGHIIWLTMGAKPVKRAFLKTPSAITSIGYAPTTPFGLTTSHADGIVRVWSAAATPREMLTITGHYGSVAGFAYEINGRMIATGGADWTVRQWQLGTTARERFPLKGHWSQAHTVQFAPSGASLASGSEDRTARIWDLSRPVPSQQAQLNKDNTAVYAVAHSPDGKTLAVGGNHTIARLWDLTKRNEIRNYPGHPSSVSQLYFLPDGKRLLASSHKSVVLWNAETAREIFRFDGHEQRVNAMTMSPDGKYVLTGTGYYAYKDGKIVTVGGEYVYDDCTIRLWDLKDGKLKQEVTKQEKPISSLTFSPDGRTFACGMWYKPTSLWTAAANALTNKGMVKNTSAWAHIHLWSPDGKRLVTLGNDYRLRLTEVAGDKVLKEWVFDETIAKVAFSPDGRYLAVSIITGPVYILRLNDVG